MTLAGTSRDVLDSGPGDAAGGAAVSVISAEASVEAITQTIIDVVDVFKLKVNISIERDVKWGELLSCG